MRALVALLALAAVSVAQAQEGSNNVPVEGCRPDSPVDLVFVVDSSGSIQEQDAAGWSRVKMFITQVTRQFNIGPSGTRVGLTVYSEFATSQSDDPRLGDDSVGFFDLNTFRDSQSLENAINRLYYFNSLTNTQDGLKVAHSVIFTPGAGDRPNAPNLAIVITDGVSNVDPDKVPIEALKLKEKATVVAVGVAGANIDELKQIASADNLVLQVTDFRALEQELTRIVSSACGAVTPMGGEPGRCCDFDGEYAGKYCDFEQSGISRFSLNQGGTPSEGTGPENADSGVYYAYLEASNLDKDDDAVLQWSNIGLNGTCLSFAYNMYGSHVGQLFVEGRESASGEWADIWNTTEATSNGWDQVVIELNVLINDLRFRAVRGEGYQGDIALDTVRLTEGACFEPEPEPEGNDTDNATCPEPPPPQPPIIYYPFFQPPRMMPSSAPPTPPQPEEDEEQEDFSKSALCVVSEPFQVLLVGGPNATLGRVEVYYNKTFGTVCNGTFGQREAAAVCRAAGFYGGSVLDKNTEGLQTLDANDEKPVYLDNVRCKRGADLASCCRGSWGKVSCDHSQDAYVKCDAQPAYCDRKEGDPPPPPGADLDLCDGVAPAFSVLLRDGAKPSEGRVEIYFDGQFGTVCNDTFGVKEAMAVCRSLGYYAGNVWRNPPEDLRLSQGVDRPVLLSGVKCSAEDKLGDCCYNAIGFDDGCAHEQDVFVRCYSRPEFCAASKGGCANPAERKKPEPKKSEEEEKPTGPPGPPKPPTPQIFPIPINPYFAMPYGHPMVPPIGGLPPMGMMQPPNGQQQGGD